MLNQPFTFRVIVVSSDHVAGEDIWNIVDKDVDMDEETLADPNSTFTPAVNPPIISNLNEKSALVFSVLDLPTLYWMVSLCSAGGSITILTIFHFPVKDHKIKRYDEDEINIYNNSSLSLNESTDSFSNSACSNSSSKGRQCYNSPTKRRPSLKTTVVNTEVQN
ncbi:unnamed protein product [Mytilus coruscus]|uniref:Uncharacterized protein n=1 Tax=Mytilus coruscus TaxID=42192 RepID=A0A6J8DGK5_MYTCO|nr:unnamed protein product [Mytilus coruscus]